MRTIIKTQISVPPKALKRAIILLFIAVCFHCQAWTGWNSNTILSLSKAHNDVQSILWVKEFPALMFAEFSGSDLQQGGKRLRSNSRKQGLRGQRSLSMQEAQNGALHFQAGVFSTIRYIKENTASTVAFSLARKKTAFGLHYSYSGITLYNQQQIGFSYGQSFGKHLNFGLSASYITHSKVEGFRGDALLDISISALCKISPAWKIYSLAEIPITIYSKSEKKSLSNPYYFRLGVGYSIIESLSLGIDIAKDLRYPLQGAAGLSYLLAKHFLIYASTEVYPFVHTFGLGFLSKKWNVELYGSYQATLGFTTSVGISWRVAK
jgi:hypothetical protein